MPHDNEELTERELCSRAIAALTELERRLGRDLPKDQVRKQPVSKIILALLELADQLPEDE